MHFTREDILEYYGLIRVLTRIKIHIFRETAKHCPNIGSQTVFCSTEHKKRDPVKLWSGNTWSSWAHNPWFHCIVAAHILWTLLTWGWMCVCVCVCVGGGFHLYRCTRLYPPLTHTSVRFTKFRVLYLFLYLPISSTVSNSDEPFCRGRSMISSVGDQALNKMC